MVQRSMHRHPRHFSSDRLTTEVRRRLRGLSLTVEDIQYAFTYGTRVRRGRYTAIVVRRRDLPKSALALEAIARRDGIVLLVDRKGLVRDVWRDRDACRKFRGHGWEMGARTRNHRFGW